MVRSVVLLLLCAHAAWAEDIDATGRIVGDQIEIEIFNPPTAADRAVLEAPGLRIPASRVASYAEVGPPIAVVFVICTTKLCLNTSDDLFHITQGMALARLNKDLPAGSEVAVISYDTGAQLRAPFMPVAQFDPELLGGYENYEYHDGGDLAKAVALALDQLEHAHAPRKAMIILGNGSDPAENVGLELGRLRDRAYRLGVDIWAPVYKPSYTDQQMQIDLLTDHTPLFNSGLELGAAIATPFDRLRARKFAYFPTATIPHDGVRRLYKLQIGFLDGPPFAFALPEPAGAGSPRRFAWPLAAIGGALLVLGLVLLARRRAAAVVVLLLATRARADTEVNAHVIPDDQIEVEVTNFPATPFKDISLETMGIRTPAIRMRSYADAGEPLAIAIVVSREYRIGNEDELTAALDKAALGRGMPRDSTGFVVEYGSGVHFVTPRMPLASLALTEPDEDDKRLVLEVDDGVEAALDELERAGPRKALFVIGPGTDSLPVPTRHRLADLGERARRQGVLVIVIMRDVSWESSLSDYDVLTPNRIELSGVDELAAELAKPIEALRNRKYLYFSTAVLPHDGTEHSYTLHLGEQQVGPMMIGLAAPPPPPRPASKRWVFFALGGFLMLGGVAIFVRTSR